LARLKGVRDDSVLTRPRDGLTAALAVPVLAGANAPGAAAAVARAAFGARAAARGSET